MKSIVIALAGTTIALTLTAIFGTLPVAAAEKSLTYTDPVEYCRVFGTVDYPGQRYQGSPTPEWIASAMGSTASDPGRVDWRCMDGRVLACIDQTLSGHGCEQMSLGRTPGPEQWAYCRQHPNSDVIPLAVMGWNSAYLWDCAGRVPRAHESALRLDRRGFILDDWREVSGPPKRVAAQSSRAVLPVTPVRVSSGFFDPNYPPDEQHQHLGIDLLGSVGTSVVAPEEGEVVFNNTATATATVDEAYLVIRNANGGEHVLGHIVSPLRIGAHVVAGQEVGTIREWPGQPGRSHLHWGVNALGVSQAMRDGWGWGRAPITATEAEALVRGWVNFNSLVSSAPAQAANVYPDPVAYCRANGTVDAPGISYDGPVIPEWIYRALDRTPSDFGRITWRCAGGSVLACADASNGVSDRCKQYSVTGRTPRIKSQGGWPLDNRGFVLITGYGKSWISVTPALAASRPVPMTRSSRTASEDLCYQALRASELAGRADGTIVLEDPCTPRAFNGWRGPVRTPPEGTAPGEWCFQLLRNARVELAAGNGFDMEAISECVAGDAFEEWLSVQNFESGAPASGRVGVQVGAYSSQAAAEIAWSKMVKQHSALFGVPYLVLQDQMDIGTVYRLQAVTGDAVTASELCSKLKAAGQACQVK